MKNKVKPKLRFPEFEDDWKEQKFDQIVSLSTDKYNPEKEEVNHRCIELEHIDSESGILLGFTDSINLGSIKNKFEKGDVLFGKLRPYLKKYIIAPFDGVCSSEIWVLKGKSVSNEYLFFLINTSAFIEFANVSSGSKMPRADWKVISAAKFLIPAFPEQAKIANFLYSIDEKIQALTKKKTLLEYYKKGVMQRLFSQEIRFKDEQGYNFPDWEEKQLNQLLSEPRRRNKKLKFSKNDVLSVSGEFGIVNQIEHLGRSYAGESVANYHVVREGDIVYTKSPLKANPYGIIKTNKGRAGIVSTLYAVYSCKEELHSDYLDFYFQLDDNTNSYLRPLVKKGAKNDMKVNNTYVLSGSISIPSKKEQMKVAKFLIAFDEKIKDTVEQLEAAHTYKKGLLQKMFV